MEAFNSLACFCLKGNNLHNRRSPTYGQRRPYHYCLKGRTLAVVQMNIRTSKKEHWSIRWFTDLLMNSGWCRGYNIQLRVFASSWQIKVLPSRQVSDDDSYRRINSAVMKIRLFKPKTPSNTEISIAVEAFNSLAHFAWKAITFITAGRRPADKDTTNICCLKGRTTAIAQTNIHAGEKRTNKTKIRNLKFLFLYFPFLYFLLILNYGITPSEQSP